MKSFATGVAYMYIHSLFNNLTSVLFCVCPLIADKLFYDIVKVAVQPQVAIELVRSKLYDNVIAKFIFNKKTDA